jgi:DNA processing protein
MPTITPAELLGTLSEAEAKAAPEILHYAGDIEIARTRPRVSVVGTRSPTDRGRANTIGIVRKLVEANIVVVSGLAMGIDTVAHRTAIDAGGHTIAVLGTSLDDCTPVSNHALQDEIMHDHLAISQFGPSDPMHKGRFPARNKTMALLSDATIVIEASDSSGTRHQGWEALKLGRLLFFPASLLQQEDLEWPKKMVEYGAQVLDADNLEHVVQEMPKRGPVSIDL